MTEESDIMEKDDHDVVESWEQIVEVARVEVRLVDGTTIVRDFLDLGDALDEAEKYETDSQNIVLGCTLKPYAMMVNKANLLYVRVIDASYRCRVIRSVWTYGEKEHEHIEYMEPASIDKYTIVRC